MSKLLICPKSPSEEELKAPIRSKTHHKIIIGDCLKGMKLLEDESVDLVITSPPYNVGKEYEREMTRVEYQEFASQVMTSLRDVLKPDGRFCVNVANQMFLGGNKKIVFSPLLVWLKATENAELKFRDIITWDQLHSGCATAWGSWLSASAPWLRHMVESIIVGYKNKWKKSRPGESDITLDEFVKFTLDKWRFSPEVNREHPAPFPEELPYRCIKLFSYVGDLVLDPFAGSFTTTKVARDLSRNSVSIEIIPTYWEDIGKGRTKANVPTLDNFARFEVIRLNSATNTIIEGIK